MKKFALLLALLASSCTAIPDSAYFNRGQPESLLRVSEEDTNVDLDNPGGIRQLTDWVDKQAPNRAVLVCTGDAKCDIAAEVLDQYNIPYETHNGPRNMATLTFENIVAKDCNNSFISNHINPYNLNHPTFGCSTAVNQVQMVSDKSQFIDPKIQDPYDGAKAVQNYDSYLSREKIDLGADDFATSSKSQ